MTAVVEPFIPASIGFNYVAGMLTSLSPCVLPLLPLVVGGAMHEHPAAPLLMGLGMTTAFATGGWIVGAMGAALGLDPEWLHRAAAFSLIVFGLVLWFDPLAAMVSRLVQPLANSANRMASTVGHRSSWASFFFGGLLGLAWTPCAGPMLISSLALVAAGSNPVLGALMLGLFGLGAATPLVIAAYASRAGYNRLRGWALGHSTGLKHGFGLIAVLSGIFLATGIDRTIAAAIVGVLPYSWLELITRY